METNKNGVTHNLENLLKGGLEGAQKRFQGLEAEAGKLVQGLKSRGQESRKEVEALLGKLDKLEAKELNQLLAHPRVKELGQKVDQASIELRKRFGGLQTRVVESVGVASQSQVRQIHREISKLSKKLDVVVDSATAAVVNGAARVTGKKAASDKSDAPRV